MKMIKLKGLEMLASLDIDNEKGWNAIKDININDYDRALIAEDAFLSGWGMAKDKTHYQIVLLNNSSSVKEITERMKKDGFKSFQVLELYDIKGIRTLKNNKKTYSVKNINNSPLWREESEQ